jgi:TonB family protein
MMPTVRALCLLLPLVSRQAPQVAPPSAVPPEAVTVPGTAEGNVKSVMPFGLGSPYDAPQITGRYQQVYASAAFNGKVMSITSIAFRNDQNNAPAGGTSQLGDVVVALSVTKKPVGGLDTVFANNLTAPATTVYAGALSFSWSAAAGTARPFELEIPFQKPFLYDPSMGNLLLDVTVIEGNRMGGTFALDAVSNNTMTSCVSHESASDTGWQDARGGSCFVPLVTQFRTGQVVSPSAILTPHTGTTPVPGGGAAAPGPFRVPGVTPPTILSRVEPNYTDEARAARYQGVVVLEVIVRKDGTADVLRVIRALGFGLDEQAIVAVKQWRFRPGTRDGQPVDVLLSVEVNFNLR